MELDLICSRFRAIPTPVICDAMYELGIPEQVLSSRLRPLLPTKRVAGAAFTLMGRAIEPELGWDAGTTAAARDLWSHAPVPGSPFVGGSTAAAVPPHGHAMWRLSQVQ